MLDIDFPNESFDFVIANHVLEHVDDCQRAVSEIHRVLKVGGHAILQTPFSRILTQTWEDPGIKTVEARTEAYGQGDHVRLFGRDVFERLSFSGLVSRVEEHDCLLTECDPSQFGVNRAEPFFHFQRAA